MKKLRTTDALRCLKGRLVFVQVGWRRYKI